MAGPAHRPFGKSGNSGAALALGCGFVKFAGFERSIETVHRAFELGIRYFDTSVLYRSGVSQAVLGEALAARTEKYFLATKVGYFKEAKHFRSVDALHVQLRESLRLLRRDSVDLLQIHEAEWDNWWTDRSDVGEGRLFELEGSFDFARAPVVQFLQEAKAQGLCRYIGITGNHARHLGRLISELNGLDSVLVAYNYTPLNVTARDFVLPAATAKGMAVVIAGQFTFVYSLPKGWATEGSYLGQRSDRQLGQLQKLQQECGIPMAELSLRFAVADDSISSILAGACHPHEVEQNVAAFQRGKLPADVHAAVEAIAKQFA